LVNRILTELKKSIPEVMKLLDFVEISTPLTADHYCNTNKGAIYGLEATPARFMNKDLRV